MQHHPSSAGYTIRSGRRLLFRDHKPTVHPAGADDADASANMLLLILNVCFGFGSLGPAIDLQDPPPQMIIRQSRRLAPQLSSSASMPRLGTSSVRR